jgi:hypothetical protein
MVERCNPLRGAGISRDAPHFSHGTENPLGSRETHIVALGFAAIRSYGLPHDGLFFYLVVRLRYMPRGAREPMPYI